MVFCYRPAPPSRRTGSARPSYPSETGPDGVPSHSLGASSPCLLWSRVPPRCIPLICQQGRGRGRLGLWGGELSPGFDELALKFPAEVMRSHRACSDTGSGQGCIPPLPSPPSPTIVGSASRALRHRFFLWLELEPYIRDCPNLGKTFSEDLDRRPREDPSRRSWTTEFLARNIHSGNLCPLGDCVHTGA